MKLPFPHQDLGRIIERRNQPQGSTAALQTSSTFLRLPGEIRNQIFDLCISRALASPKSAASRSRPTEKGFMVTVYPRWHGSGSISMDGIGSIPLLFVCKQIYNDLSSLIYSVVDKICIGGYILQHRTEDPSLRWKYAYSLLKKRPNLQNFTRNVRIRLPCVRDDLLCWQWNALGLKYPESSHNQPGKYNTWAVLPDLEAFLSTFKHLSSLEIVITVEKVDAPDFQRLLPLYDLCGKETSIEFLRPQNPSGIGNWSIWASQWETAWNECLFISGRI